MESLEFQKVSVADLQQELESQRKRVDDGAAVAGRAPQCDAVLLDETALWISGLPVAVRPIELARTLPRIANGIAKLWRRVTPCEQYLDALAVDRPGDRTGLPPEIARELAALRRYYAELHPPSGSAWDLVAQDD